MAYKRFLLFTFDRYYPSGGEDDVAGSFDTLDAAIDAASKGKYGQTPDAAQVLDMKAREFVWRTHFTCR